MSYLDPIFASYPMQGFQDIWFLGLAPTEVECLFEFACKTFGNGTVPICRDGETAFTMNMNTLYEVDYNFNPLIFNGVRLDGVAIRIEKDELAIDFNGGIDYWIDERQIAFIAWLHMLQNEAPNAQLAWAHEGCVSTPSENESKLLRDAVACAA